MKTKESPKNQSPSFKSQVLRYEPSWNFWLEAWGLVLGAWFLELGIWSCTPRLNIPEPDPGTANFQKTIAIGGNYLAGYQDGALYLNGQKHSIPALLAEQFALAGGGAFVQPLMPDNSGLGLNSKPWESEFITSSTLGYKDSIRYLNTGSCSCDTCWGKGGLSPIKRFFGTSDASSDLKPLAGGNFQNLSVPFAMLQDLFDPSLGNSYPGGSPYYHRFASNPGVSTVIADALVQNPTFFIFWLGMEEIYEYARNGGYKVNIPNTSSFSNNLDSILALLTSDGAKGVIANIPDLESFPFYILIPYNGVELTQDQANQLNDAWVLSDHIHFEEGSNAFVIAVSNSPFGFRHIKSNEYLLLNAPLDSMKCFFYGTLFLIDDRYALDSVEIDNIRQAIKTYNQIINQKANQYDLAFVDMNAWFKNLQTGIKWDGVDVNAEFISGGFFSLDGYHPNQKGYALIANEFIKAINQKYDAVIPPVNCSECIGIRFP